jgi:hypothetical protein
MPVMTFRAADSASAMDQVIRRLGEDALILSTTSKAGLVEIVATDEPVETPRPRTTPARVAAPGASALPAGDPAPARPEPPATPAPGIDAAAAMPRAFADFLPHEVQAQALRARVLTAPRVVLVGPVGAGKSLLALQLAAERLGADPGASAPRFFFAGSPARTDAAALTQKAALFGLETLFGDPRLHGADPGTHPDICVLSGLAPDPAPLAAALAGAGAPVLLVLPAGLRPDRIAAMAAAWSGLACGTVLTFSPGAAPEGIDRDACHAAGLPVLWAARRTVLVDALEPPHAVPATPPATVPVEGEPR